MVTKIAVANLEATPPEKGLFNLWQRDETWIIRCVRDYKQLLKWRNRKLFQTGPLVNLDYTLRNPESENAQRNLEIARIFRLREFSDCVEHTHSQSNLVKFLRPIFIVQTFTSQEALCFWGEPKGHIVGFVGVLPITGLKWTGWDWTGRDWTGWDWTGLDSPKHH